MGEEIRCPMCSKLNPPGTESCAFCGARLKPLLAPAAPDESSPGLSPSAPDRSEEEAAGEDWLARMRTGAAQDDLEEDLPKKGEGGGASPDWLGRLREVGPADEGPPAGEVPDWLGEQPEQAVAPAGAEPGDEEPGGAEPAQIPDWLSRVRERQAQEVEPAWEPEPEGEPSEVDEGWLARIRDSGEPVGEGLPSSGGPAGAAAPEVEGEAQGPTLDWGDLTPSGEREAAEAASVDSGLSWREDSGADTGWLEEVPPDGEPGTPKTARKQGVQEGWLSELEATADESEGLADRRAADKGAAAKWLGNAEIVVEKPFTANEDEIGGPEAAEAEWLKELERGTDEPSSRQDQEPARVWETAGEGSLDWLAEYDASIGRPQPEEVEEPGPAGDEGAPGWLSEINAPGGQGPSLPEEARTAQFEEPSEPIPEPPEELPHVPALVFKQPGQAASAQGQDFDLDSIEGELPDWLGEPKAGGTGGEAGGGQAGADLAPATLPAWLEAMRPISTFRSVVDVAEEQEATLESAGPLAGLRGVLMAEPVVAMPRAPTIGAAKLEVTERQYAQAELLHQIVEEEERELSTPDKRRLRLPMLRWVVSAVMLLAVILPITVGTPSFSLPTQVSRDLLPLMGLVNDLPVDRPSLIIFDFDPGYSGEMDTVAGAFLDQVMGRGVPVVSLSTRPSGPALAVNLLNRIAARHGVSPGTGYLHLGYLSGGPAAVQIFSASPRDAVHKGFDIPEAPDGEETCGGWDCPILSGVQRLSDFGMVAVISSGTENARVWAEQAHPFMGQVPLVMVLSAGAEPLIRPYYEALQPQVNGILSGLPAAVAYEQANLSPGEAHSRWNPFGAALAATEAMLAAGVIYGLARWLLRTGRLPRE